MKKVNSKFNRQTRLTRRVWRLILVAYIIIGLFLTAEARLFYLQMLCGADYAQKAERQHTIKVPLESHRGKIFDRNGEDLAVELPQFYTVGVYPSQINNENQLCRELASYTKRPVAYYYRRLRSPSEFIFLEWRLLKQQAQKLQAKNFTGVKLLQAKGRFYPYHRATAQLLGYTDIDQHGISGLELFCDAVLQGSQGWETHQRNGRGLSFWDPLRGYTPPVDGGSVRLSIDIVAQEVLHQELEAALTFSRSRWVGGILLNPQTGDILAICSLPDFDPLRPEIGAQSNHRLRPLTDLFEPGSVFKIVGAAAALDQGLISPSDSIYCEEGRYHIGNKIFRDAHPFGWLSFEDILVYSSNIGMAKIAERIGSKELYRYALKFGIGTPTGIAFPGEASGKLRPFDQWKEIDRASIAIGQGVSTTMLQIAMLYAAIANNGILMEPRLILEQTDAKGHTQVFPPRSVRYVMKPETANLLKRILTQVVERGTGRSALLPGLKVAGKTGTAQIPNLESGGYYQDRFVATFIGFIPAENPDRLLIITVCDPKGAHYGSQVAAPVFKRVMERLQPADAIRRSWQTPPMDLAEIIPAAGSRVNHPATRGYSLSEGDNPNSEHQTVATNTVVPELRGLSIREAVYMLSTCGIRVKIKGTGWVKNQSLPAGSTIEKNSICVLTAQP